MQYVKNNFRKKSMVESLERRSQQSGRPIDETITQYLLQAILRRVANSAWVREFILRGGMLTQLWVPQGTRIAVDIDFLAQYSFSVEETAKKFSQALCVKNLPDQVEFKLETLKATTIWAQTQFPGVRLKIDASVENIERNLQIDIGFGDPLSQPPEWIEYPTLLAQDTIKILAVSPETMIAWKLHGLVEQSSTNWRPKDLYDLMLLTKHTQLDEDKLKKAIPLAFSSRTTPLEKLIKTLSLGSWWNNSKNRSKWARYQRLAPTQIMPSQLTVVTEIVINKYLPLLKTLEVDYH